MNLNGLWKGKYTYGSGYSLEMIGKSELFELNIIDNDGIFTGSCIDEIVKSIPGNNSEIEGVFKDNYISFFKKYRYYSIIDNSDGKISIDDIKFDGIHYTGNLLKRFFSGKEYFKGEWTITSEYRNKETNEVIVSTIEGTWRMEKA